LAADLDAALVRAGFEDVRAAHAPLFMTIDPAGSTVTELAGRTHMTKQATGDLVRHLEKGGYVRVRTVEADRRARLVELTDRGWQVLDAGLAIVAGFDDWLSHEIGAHQVTALRNTLDRIITTDWAAAATAPSTRTRLTATTSAPRTASSDSGW
jgi:DNA-binding MarR family transcriptional regulator